jgi:uncharacterized damage-inducible protein DinB
LIEDSGLAGKNLRVQHKRSELVAPLFRIECSEAASKQFKAHKITVILDRTQEGTMAFATETDLRYPIGKFQRPEGLTDDQRRAAIQAIEEAPAKIRAAVAGLNDPQLDTPYRPGGWTIRQTVHHLADSHMNAFTRFKLALTEDVPTIKPYLEARWAELVDSKSPVESSLEMLEGLHNRWVLLLRSLTPADLAREFLHPEHGKKMSLDQTLALYSWHGRHHAAHITSLRERNSWR